MAKKNKGGRPKVWTKTVQDDVRKAALVGATIEQAAGYAGISEKTLRNYMNDDLDFKDKFKQWQSEPKLRAKFKVVTAIEGDVNTAKWYLERTEKDNFALRSEYTGKDGADLPQVVVYKPKQLKSFYDEEKE